MEVGHGRVHCESTKTHTSAEQYRRQTDQLLRVKDPPEGVKPGEFLTQKWRKATHLEPLKLPESSQDPHRERRSRRLHSGQQGGCISSPLSLRFSFLGSGKTALTREVVREAAAKISMDTK